MPEKHLLCTIGYTKKTAEQFFQLLSDNGVEMVIDVRANNTSQLAAFTKRSDLPYLLKGLLGIDYAHWSFLAPTPEIRETLARGGPGWFAYQRKFQGLLRNPDVWEQIDEDVILNRVCCLLCSEPTAEQCHRRLVAEHLQAAWPHLEIRHL